MAKLDKGYDEVVAAKNEAVVRATLLESALKEEHERSKRAEDEHLLFKASSEDRMKFLEVRH